MRFYKRSPTEVSALAQRLENITTVDDAIKRLGRPDVDRGRVVDYIYWNGTRTPIGYKRALFYDHLARTVTVVVAEDLNGRVEVKLNPKEKQL